MKATVLLRQISILAFLVVCLAGADALDASDDTRFANLARKFVQLQKDIASDSRASQAEQEFECLREFYNNIAIMSEQIHPLQLMVRIALSMNDKSDEQTVVDMLNEEAADVLEFVDNNRRAINSTVGYCSSNNVAVAKAQEILTLYSEASSVVRSIMKAR